MIKRLDKWIDRSKPEQGLVIICILQLAAYLLPLHLEWKLLFFAVSLTVSILWTVDSRFFIIAAILHIWLAPFMLLSEQAIYAESTATYAYYYLAIGVIGQIIEHRRAKAEVHGRHPIHHRQHDEFYLPSLMEEHEQRRKRAYARMMDLALSHPVWGYLLFTGALFLALAYSQRIALSDPQYTIMLTWYVASVALGFLLARWLRGRLQRPREE